MVLCDGCQGPAPSESSLSILMLFSHRCSEDRDTFTMSEMKVGQFCGHS